jgi:hypothetical protein
MTRMTSVQTDLQCESSSHLAMQYVLKYKISVGLRFMEFGSIKRRIYMVQIYE